MNKKVLVVGCGAAGMMAAYRAALCGADVTVIDHNEKPGKKIYITGKGRCNLTNACTVEELISHVNHGGKFLYSAFYGFTADNTMSLFEELGCPLKVERGNRVFPVSDHASDVTKAIYNRLCALGVRFRFNCHALSIDAADECVRGLTVKDVSTGKTENISCDSLILATGGRSYPTTGSDGSGYELAVSVGHKVTALIPGLCGLHLTGKDHRRLEGLSLKNISLRIQYKDNNTKQKCQRSVLFKEQGELIFTALGISGPLVLKASSLLNPSDFETGVIAAIDLKPALDENQLDARLLRDFDANKNKRLSNILRGLYPASLTPVMIERCGISPETPANSVTVAMRKSIVHHTKNLCFNITGIGGFNEAVITRGGVELKEVNSSTCESKLVKGLYFAGEILDLDAFTGGFNLQIAWSTGYLAGESAAGL